MIIDPRFLNEFNLWFNVDLIHFNDRRRMIEDAIALADKAAGWPHATEILQQLDYVLKTQQSQEVLQFIERTNVDWYADEATTALLFDILTTVQDRLALSLQRHA